MAEEKGYKISKPIFNIEQQNYYMENGAIARKSRIKYYEDTDKVLFYVCFELNDKYQELKKNWMNYDR